MGAIGPLGAIVVGIAAGVLSAWRRGSAIDRASTSLALAFYAFPTQFLGLMLLILLIVQFAIWAHASSVAQATAEEALAAARVRQPG